MDSSRFAGCTSGARTVKSWSGLLGASWGRLGGLFGASWASLGLLGASWGRLGQSWGALAPFGPFGGRLGGFSGPPWGVLGVFLGRFGSLLDSLGCLFGHYWDPLGPSRSSLGCLKCRLGATWRLLQNGPKSPAKVSPRRPRCRPHCTPRVIPLPSPHPLWSAASLLACPAASLLTCPPTVREVARTSRDPAPRRACIFGSLARRGQPAAGARHGNSHRNGLWNPVDACQSPPEGGPGNARGSSTVLKHLLQDAALPVKAQSTRRIGRCSGPRSLGMPCRLQTTPSTKEK